MRPLTHTIFLPVMLFIHIGNGEEQSCNANVHGTACDNDIPATEDQQKFSRLLEWMQEGIYAYVPRDLREGLAPLKESLALTSDRVLVTKQKLVKGQVLARIPAQRVIHYGYYKTDQEDLHSKEKLRVPPTEMLKEGVKSHFVSALAFRPSIFSPFQKKWGMGELRRLHLIRSYIMEHRRLGSASFWDPAIAMFQQTWPGSPLMTDFSQEQWALLEGSRFKEKVEEEKRVIRETWLDMLKQIPELDKNYTFQDFLSAHLTVVSRSFCCPSIVPVADMFNHIGPDQANCKVGLDEVTDTWEIAIQRDVSIGEELSVSYGERCSSDRILYYGFASPEVPGLKKPVATVQISFPLDDEVEDRQEREDWLKTMRRMQGGGDVDDDSDSDEDSSFQGQFIIQATDKGADAEDMLNFARFISLPASDFETTCSFSWPVKCKNTSPEIERMAVKRIARVAHVALKAYPTSIEEDERTISSIENGIHRNFVILRRDEKVVLKWWKRFCKRFEKQLKSKGA
eukprot:TRINITY_DN24368_c0_g1_i1.p1 TRINITY_DN24368_c0_g1~~TRINITY_DN24368_c0_g1_i1.p1  ORF type:complete len:512 (-),score=84.29 TRINITY_DN24368_c0_g1_i1:41-1576(-)